ncbi:MAG: hypothetical protein IT186_02380 [Acidobacteria bacterium]|nr:hypothetical protein [Acidobacteriota bacterium]
MTNGDTTPRTDQDFLVPELLTHHRVLRGAAVAWAHGVEPSAAVTHARHRTLSLLHQRYATLVPVYRELAERENALGPIPLGNIVDRFLLLDLFRSYDPVWLAERNLPALTEWLGTICTRQPGLDLSGVSSLSQWRERLRAAGIYLSFSSATSGRMAFIPKDLNTVRALATNGAAYTDEGWRTRADGTLEEFDCLVAGPRSGGMGILDAGSGIARTAARSHFLFEEVLGADAVSAGNPWNTTVPGAPVDEAYQRAFAFIRRSSAEERKLLVFGAPFQIKRLCERIAATCGSLPASPGSLVVTGGGWKSFAGESLPRTGLQRLIAGTLRIEGKNCIDAYSTSEINCTFRTCPRGAYHIPPLIEPVVLNEAYTGTPGESGTGVLAFLDPFALSYPGFVITGDVGTLVHGRCACGLPGPVLAGEIRRAPGFEVRGCGGVLESLQV